MPYIFHLAGGAQEAICDDPFCVAEEEEYRHSEMVTSTLVSAIAFEPGDECAICGWELDKDD